MNFLRGNENERKEGSKTAVKYPDTFPDIIMVEGCNISNKPVISKQDTLLTPKKIIRDFKPTNSTKIGEDDLIKVKMKQLFNQMKYNIKAFDNLSIQQNAFICSF